jgi:transposase
MAPIRPVRSELSETQRAIIWTLREQGKSYSEISALKNVPKSTVADTINLVRQNIAAGTTNHFASRTRIGRPPKLSGRDTRALCRASVKDRHASLRVLATPSKSSHQLHRQTVRHGLKTGGISRRKARKKPALTEAHKKRRREFYRVNKGRNWGLINWSDEVHFYSDGKTGNMFVSRRISEEFLDETVQPTYKVVGYTISA